VIEKSLYVGPGTVVENLEIDESIFKTEEQRMPSFSTAVGQ